MRQSILHLAWFGIGLIGLTLGSACAGPGVEDPGSGGDPVVATKAKHKKHVPCGDTTCGAGEICCSESCGICGPKGGVCPDIQCAPAGEPCGDTTCGANEICCSASCGICGPKDGVCPDIACAP